MPLPKQAIVPNDRFLNAPYNFVPLPEAVLEMDRNQLPWHNRYILNRHTGYIELDIATETLFYTRCAYPFELGKADVHNTFGKQNFFHHKNAAIPVIPGSSLRGMFRNLVEVIGFGKMGKESVYKERLVYRAVGDSTSLGTMYRQKMLGIGSPLPYPSTLLKGGYLKVENGKYFIQPAVEYHGESFVHTRGYPDFARIRTPAKTPYKASDIIDVWVLPPHRRTRRAIPPKPDLSLADVPLTDIQNGDLSPGARWVRAKLVRSGHMGGNSPKHMHCVIYESDNNSSLIPIDSERWRLFEKDRDQNRGIPCREIRHSGDPLFYLVNANREPVFWGPTMMFRMLYDHDVHEFIPVHLKDENKTDLAEAIFGTTERKGRIRFSDSVFTERNGGGSPFLSNHNQGRIVPKILSSPKPTSFQNYLVQPKPGNKRDLHHYAFPYNGNTNYQITSFQGGAQVDTPTKGTVIRGDKFYWNKQTTEASISDSTRVDVLANQEKPQNTIIKPVVPNCRFSGKIYFENLSDTELGVLLVSLRLNNNNARHRLGMGKPYGMGRVKITGKLMIEDRRQRYVSLTVPTPLDSAEVEEKSCKAFENILIQHHLQECMGNTVSSIWDIPRLSALALLLDKDGPGSPGCDYTSFQDTKIWRNRKVLPTAHQVMEKEEPAFYAPSEPFNNGNSSAVVSVSSPPPRPQRFEFENNKIKSKHIKVRIEMMQPKDVEEFVEIIDEMAMEGDEAPAKILAEILKQKMIKLNIWAKHKMQIEINTLIK